MTVTAKWAIQLKYYSCLCSKPFINWWLINDHYKCQSICLQLIYFYLLLTQTDIFCITAKKILDATAVVCILTNFMNNQCALMTHTLLWITWLPRISRLWISISWTVKSYTLFCCNITFFFVLNSINLGWICRFEVVGKTKSTLYLIPMHWVCESSYWCKINSY